MNGNHSTVVDWDNFLKNLAAELTGAAYPVALRHRVGYKWLDLELDLWKSLTETVKKWGRKAPRTGSPDEFEVWREGLLVELTEESLHLALTHGVKGFFLEVELDLFQAFRSVMWEINWTRVFHSMAAEVAMELYESR
jgi:hypothetical protein